MARPPTIVLATPAGIDPEALSRAVATFHPDATVSVVGIDRAASMPGPKSNAAVTCGVSLVRR